MTETSVYLFCVICICIYILKYSFQWKNENSHWNRIDNLISALNCSYMFSISVIGIGYTLLQTIAFVTLQIMMKNDKYLVFAFYGDKVQSSSYVFQTNFILSWISWILFLAYFVFNSFLFIYIYKYIKHSQCNFHICKREGKKKKKRCDS